MLFCEVCNFFRSYNFLLTVPSRIEVHGLYFNIYFEGVGVFKEGMGHKFRPERIMKYCFYCLKILSFFMVGAFSRGWVRVFSRGSEVGAF